MVRAQCVGRHGTPRNLYRDAARAFAYDAPARAIPRGVAEGNDW